MAVSAQFFYIRDKLPHFAAQLQRRFHKFVINVKYSKGPRRTIDRDQPGIYAVYIQRAIIKRRTTYLTRGDIAMEIFFIFIAGINITLQSTLLY